MKIGIWVLQLVIVLIRIRIFMNPKMLETRLRFWREMVGITRPMYPVSFRFCFFSVLTVHLILICMYIKFQKLIMKEQNLNNYSREKYLPRMGKWYVFVQVFMLMYLYKYLCLFQRRFVIVIIVKDVALTPIFFYSEGPS